MTESNIQKAWNDFCENYDMHSDDWLDMGADEYYFAGYKSGGDEVTQNILNALKKLSIASDDYVVCGGSPQYADGMDYVIKQIKEMLINDKEL